MRAKRTGVILKPDHSRVFFRPFEFANRDRIPRIFARVAMLSDAEVDRQVAVVVREFADRHQRLRTFFLERFERVSAHVFTDRRVSEARKLLIGAYLSQEYSLEAAALFNPSIVAHPDQSDVPAGSLRFILSLRATGEGHLSSIVFRTGLVDRDGRIEVRAPSRFATAPEVHQNPGYEKGLFERKLGELGLMNAFAYAVLAQMGDPFTLAELQSCLERSLRRDRTLDAEGHGTASGILALAHANYEISFDEADRMSERVIFPNSTTERRGIEDARFVEFREEDGSVMYYATYTAFDGQVTLQQLLETRDFLRFRISTLNGPQVQDKGMALFPRRIGGRYVMVSRQDGENLYLMESEQLHFWYERRILVRPTFPWEFVQVGNCGSPIETPAGWLLLTHGVGAMRKYSIGALLLDLENPGRVIGRLPKPLLTPNETEREGYVPNVVYSCGSLVHGGRLILPYAMSDQATGFAVADMDELIDTLKRNPPERAL